MFRTTGQRCLGSAVTLTLFSIAACTDAPLTPSLIPSAVGVSTNLVNKPALDITLEGEAWVCEDGTESAPNPFSFSVSVDGGPATTHNVARGTCVQVHAVSRVGSTRASVSVTENVPANWTLNSITIESNYQNRPDLYEPSISSPNATATVRNDVGVVITFGNSPLSVGGRMTGGGAQVFGDVKITRGFTIHCDITLSNNLEINWGKGNNWHIDKPLTKATCFDDPAYDETPPVAPFNTFVGEGIGRLNGVDGSKVFFTFIDAGEPGKNDKAAIRILAPDGVTVVLDVPLSLLDNGNIQAHYDQPHKQKP